jgi:phospho-N-acetylmuramoyl-pentapeptide-transferase
MLYHWLTGLRHEFGPLNVFRYITFRAALCGGFSLLLCLALGPAVIRWVRSLSLGQRIREEVPERHQAKEGTPTMGGILMLGSIIVSLLLFGDLNNHYVVIALISLVWLGLLGFADDYVKVRLGRPRGLNKRTKLIVQFALALGIGVMIYLFPADPAIRTRTNLLFFKNVQIDFHTPFIYVPFVALVIVGFSNAVNLTDGLDGLACGLLGVAAAAYAVLAYVSGNFQLAHYLDVIFVPKTGELAVVAFTLMGAAIGFLWFNSHPAAIFMGDTGSLPLGGLLGVLAVLTKQEILLLLVGGVFVIEAGSVLLQVFVFRLGKGKRLFRMAPLHHHFELKGWAEEKVVVRFWILGILFAVSAIASLKVR